MVPHFTLIILLKFLSSDPLWIHRTYLRSQNWTDAKKTLNVFKDHVWSGLKFLSHLLNAIDQNLRRYVLLHFSWTPWPSPATCWRRRRCTRGRSGSGSGSDPSRPTRSLQCQPLKTHVNLDYGFSVKKFKPPYKHFKFVYAQIYALLHCHLIFDPFPGVVRSIFPKANKNKVHFIQL